MGKSVKFSDCRALNMRLCPATRHLVTAKNNFKNLVDVVVVSELSPDPVFTFRLVCRRIKILESSCYAQTTRPFEIQK